ncbi:hypothetical protein N7451_012092 [Penicillium sp. IBT 35674x]|nr:hypothetical protein N7451_012092 [Penicillium sp. IBT 35674x]
MYGGDSIDLNAFVAQSTLAASAPLRPASTAKLGLVRRGIERQDDFPLVIRPKAWCSTFQYHDTFFERVHSPHLYSIETCQLPDDFKPLCLMVIPNSSLLSKSGDRIRRPAE